MLNTIEKNLIPGETIVRKARKSMSLMAGRAVAAAALIAVGAWVGDGGIVAVCLLAAALLLLFKWVEIRQYELVVTNRKIAAKKGIVRRSIQECPLERIDTVRVKNDLLGAMLGYGTVEVKAVNGEFRFSHIVRAEDFKNAILSAISDVREESATLQARKLAAALRGVVVPQG